MNVQFKKGVLELCVLVMLAKKDRYGFELAESISRRIDIAEGSLYPLLRRLKEQDYLSTYHVESTEGPSRKYYSMTEKGRTYMEELLEEWKQFSGAINRLIEGEMTNG
ncbi:PadR family transcriptional regulator [Cohnella sp. REN36]|uniref:PadR family transcriptional regulator n=1 Tax=Cohnella sp. REN36 TaxID=2887347 RepID=UPI001D14933F|nr:PadR family transcriptional regulator [Cohnella sp. REN36]MCC3373594.1 PadR family transcriptional regulator [Cohnella sp. REN36]